MLKSRNYATTSTPAGVLAMGYLDRSFFATLGMKTLRTLGAIAATVLFANLAMAEEIYLRCRYFSFDHYFRIDLTKEIAWEMQAEKNWRGQVEVTPDTLTMTFVHPGARERVFINRRTGELRSDHSGLGSMYGKCEKEEGKKL
jgi:hypothetical protein